MKIKTLYRQFLAQLQNIYSLNEATIITDWVFEKVAGIKRADIIAYPEQVFEQSIIQTLNSKLAELMQHKPVQYVLGEAFFCNMKLKVNQEVLVPRPETEELVRLAIGNVPLEGTCQILDIGTGSGCIAIAIKKGLPDSIVTAIDISEGAIAVAKENAAAQNETIVFLKFDFLDELQWGALPMFDMIVSNPPYIPLHQIENLDKNVSAFEPHTALFVPDDSPLLFYEKIAAFGKKHLNAGGKIFVETNEDLAPETASLFSASYPEAIIKKDMFGKARMLMVNG